ncbi:atg28p-like protein [Ophiostoma piceae UAMH 11346]|uniref:Atg28p-like protein n=1 Tax=Ophiostoma piceae (strain UAMH 11346) TaxID=1262450 RepID=S3CET5_OPHP1|nr:atg28p-like protein [Ophiostoma piceae UAMH 11346]
MAHNSFLSRFGVSRDSDPVLPLHTQNLRHKPSEYDLDELSPRAEESRLFSADPEPAFVPDRKHPTKARAPAVSFAYQDQLPSSSRTSSRPRQSDYRDYDDYEEPAGPSRYPTNTKSRTNQPAMFAGPPPPIARSIVMYRDVEERSGTILEHGRNGRNGNRHENSSVLGASSIRLPTDTVLFDARQPHSSPRASRVGSFDGESTWTILQRRERALQKEIQDYLNIQSSGLAAGLGRGPLNPSPSQGRSSDGGYGESDDSRQRLSQTNTPTAESFNNGARSVRLPTERATASGAVIPVRQPRPRKLGLRAARAGLSRGISLFASLKAEEDAALETALHTRKRALAYLNRLSGRRSNIVQELHALETDEEEPLAREMTTLQSAHKSTSEQISELEGQLAMLRQRQRSLEGRIEDAMSQRESGLSGYRGALKEVDSQLTAVLRRPPVQPLDVEALGGDASAKQSHLEGPDEGRIRLDDHAQTTGQAEVDDASAGIEFLRLLPERRTEEMARFWWETEVRILERRRKEVGSEHKALEEGGAMWLEAARLVSDFEANLRREMTAGTQNGNDEAEGSESNGKGKGRVPTPEERMRSQLATMAAVITGLRMHLQTAESKGWNLLICAIGAELEAFREARTMLRQSLRAAGLDVDEEDTEDEDADLETASKADMSENLERWTVSQTDGAKSPDNGLLLDGMSKTTPGLGGFGADEEDDATTPRLARSTSDVLSSLNKTGSQGGQSNWQHSRHHRDQAASESDDNNEVPPDLFAAHLPEYDEHDGHADSSDNEVPPDFLSEQHADDDKL